MFKRIRRLFFIHVFKEERIENIFQSSSSKNFNEETETFISLTKSTDTFYRSRVPYPLTEQTDTWTFISEDRIKLARKRMGMKEKDSKADYFEWFQEERRTSLEGSPTLTILLNKERARLLNKNKEIFLNLMVYLTKDIEELSESIRKSIFKEDRTVLGEMVVSLYENHPRLGLRMDKFAEKAIHSQKKERNLETLLELMGRLEEEPA